MQSYYLSLHFNQPQGHIACISSPVNRAGIRRDEGADGDQAGVEGGFDKG